MAISLASVARADVTATVDRVDLARAAKATTFATVPTPARDDLATQATFSLIDGLRDPNSGDLNVLHDGRMPETQDAPADNVFFDGRTVGGRIRIDLGAAKDIGQINTYSWHTNTRAPQVYTLYAADGSDADFDASPKLFIDPAMAGWTLIASVDTRPKNALAPGGQYGVSLNDPDRATLGTYRYLLLDASRTEADDADGNTFFSEIDVIAPEKVLKLKPATTPTAAGSETALKLVLDTSGLSDEMKVWANEKLKPVATAWYPKIVALLPSDGFHAPRTFTINFRTDMGGTPAYTNGTKISCNIGWFEKNKDGEGVGAVIHEMVHVVQQYKFGRKEVPFWLQEGIPDYVRWYLYEPQKDGARIRDVSNAKYDAAYRTSANFLNYVSQTYSKDVVPNLNAAVRAGKYTDDIWKTLCGGTSIDELDADWKARLLKGQP